MEYLIFEHDNYPAIKQKSKISGPNGTVFQITYRSWNKKYDHSIINVNQYNPGISSISNYSVDNSTIEYKLQ